MSDAPRPRVWVDTDVALGAPRGDVDDGFALAALFAAHLRGTVELLGISTVFGNASAALSRDCAGALARAAGLDPAILAGAERAGEDTPAAGAIAGLPPGTQLLALGPLTNVAAACRRNPGLESALELRAVGGNLSSRGFLAPLWPFEFNFARDAAGAKAVLAKPWKSLTLYPLDVVKDLGVGGEELLAARRLGPLGRALSEGSRRWLARARWRHPLRRRFPLWDLPAALDALGLLCGRYEIRRPARGAERMLAPRREFRFLTELDAAQSWERFAGLLAGALEA